MAQNGVSGGGCRSRKASAFRTREALLPADLPVRLPAGTSAEQVIGSDLLLVNLPEGADLSGMRNDQSGEIAAVALCGPFSLVIRFRN